MKPEEPNPYKSDVLHSDEHSRLSAEEIAKAVARHKREHANVKPKGSGQPKKNRPAR